MWKPESKTPTKCRVPHPSRFLRRVGTTDVDAKVRSLELEVRDARERKDGATSVVVVLKAGNMAPAPLFHLHSDPKRAVELRSAGQPGRLSLHEMKIPTSRSKGAREMGHPASGASSPSVAKGQSPHPIS